MTSRIFATVINDSNDTNDTNGSNDTEKDTAFQGNYPVNILKMWLK